MAEKASDVKLRKSLSPDVNTEREDNDTMPVDTEPPVFRTGNKELDQIRARIEATEAEMAGTLDAIQEKVSVDRLMRETEAKMKEATDATLRRAKTMLRKTSQRTRGMYDNLMETVKQNPIPVAIMGVGLAWLMTGGSILSFRKAKEYLPEERYWPEEEEMPQEYYEAGIEYQTGLGYPAASTHAGRGYGSQVRGRISEAMGRARAKAGDVQHKVGEVASHMKERSMHFESEGAGRLRKAVDTVVEKVSGAQPRAGETAGHLREKTRELGTQAQYQAERMKGGFWHMLEERPLTMGLAALAIGAIVGMSVPETRREDELMGETRESLMARTRELGEQAKEKVERVVQEAGRAAKEEAERQHLTPEATMEKAEQVAEETGRAAEREMQRETPRSDL